MPDDQTKTEEPTTGKEKFLELLRMFIIGLGIGAGLQNLRRLLR